MTNWVEVFKALGALMTYNGKEFSSEKMLKIDIRLCTTAGMGPFDNRPWVTDMMRIKPER